MTLTLQNAPDTQGFLDALKKFVAQWQGVKIETQETQDAEEFDHYISDEEILSDPETLEAMKECEEIEAQVASGSRVPYNSWAEAKKAILR